MNFQGLAKASFFLFIMFVTGLYSIGTNAQRVYPDPNNNRGFKPYELPFNFPPSALARAEDRSAAFYAIILKTGERCSIPDRERVSAQPLFPRHKVFLSRFECDPEDVITYSTIDNRYSILAVYAGSTRREAQNFLATVRKTGRFPDAYLRKMQIIRVHP